VASEEMTIDFWKVLRTRLAKTTEKKKMRMIEAMPPARVR